MMFKLIPLTILNFATSEIQKPTYNVPSCFPFSFHANLFYSINYTLVCQP